jgi:hypothetical protein
MRTGLLGGSNAEEEEAEAVDDVGDSVGSADELQDCVVIVVKEEAVDSRVVEAAVEVPEAASWAFLVSAQRRKRGKVRASIPLGGTRAPVIEEGDAFTTKQSRSSDIVNPLINRYNKKSAR